MIRKHTEAFTRLRGFRLRGKLYIQLFSFRSFSSRRQFPLWPKLVMKMNCWTTKRRRRKLQPKLRRQMISKRKMWRERTSVSTVLVLEIFFWSLSFYEPSLTVDSNILRKVRAQILAFVKFWKTKFFLCRVVFVSCRLNVFIFSLLSQVVKKFCPSIKTYFMCLRFKLFKGTYFQMRHVPLFSIKFLE